MTVPESISEPQPTPDGPEGRQRILDVAAALFLARGYEGASLREIARDVGMKPGSLYYHFESKDALLEAILRRGITVMRVAFREAAETHAVSSARVRFAAHVRAHLAALFDYGPYTAAHVTTFRTAPSEVCARIVPERDLYEAMWSDLLSDFQAQGVLAPDAPLGFTRLALFGAMNSAVDWFDRDRGHLDAFAQAIAHQFWFGMAVALEPRDQGDVL